MAWQTDDPAGDGPTTEEGKAAQRAAWKREARQNPDNQNPVRSNTNTRPLSTPATSRSKSSPSSSGSRMIVGLMFFGVTFALIGNEIKIVNGTAAKGTGGVVTEGGRIILGGVFATALLVLLSHAGDGGREFATGLALVTTATSLLVYGGPVWSAAGEIFGRSTPTTPTGATSSTKPTTATVAA